MSTTIEVGGRTMEITDRGALVLDHDASRAWGAWEAEGKEASDMGAFRRAVRRAVRAVAAERRRSIEIYATMPDASDWMVDVIDEGDHRRRAADEKESGTMRITGYQAIEAAERDADVRLCKYTDPTEEAREGLTVDEAREIAREDPGLIYADVTA